MRAIRTDGATVTLDARAEAPVPGPGEALVRPTRLGVAASDLAAASGRWPFRGLLGHEFAGVVDRLWPEADKAERKRWEGKRVVGSINIVCGRCELCRAGLSNHCRERSVLGLHKRDGCFADRFTLPVRNLHEVPAGVDDDRAVFAEPLAGAIHAAQLVRLEGKPYVTVLGDGPEALLTAQVMARMNASVRLLGEHPERFTLCEKWGIKHRHASEVGRRQDQDVVVDCSGAAAGLELALRLVRPRGKVVLKTPALPPAPAGDGSPIAPGADLAPLVANEIELLGARCGRLADALHELASGAVDVLSLITRRMRLDDGPAALRAAAEPTQIKVLLDV